MISAIASSGDFDSRMSLTSIRCRERKRADVVHDLVQAVDQQQEEIDTRATEPETSQRR
jgi:hypothetical protein